METGTTGAWTRRIHPGLLWLATGFLCACNPGGGGGGNSDDATAPPAISITDSSAFEGDAGNRDMLFEIRLSAASDDRVSVDFATEDGTAESGIDFVSATGNLAFAPRETRLEIRVQLIGDTLDEANEDFTVRLSGAVGGVLQDAAATGLIRDDDATAAQPGLDSRPDNATCLAPARANNDATVTVVDAFPLLPNIAQPTKMLLEPVADPRWFVLRKTGQLVTFDPDNATAVTTYLDLSGVVRTRSEGGLLGMAFHPDYPATPEIFLSYTIDHSGPAMRSVISRFILDDIASPGAGTEEQVILRVDQDFDNHNGGDIAFGSDGYLYIGLGDGGSGGDPNNRAQDLRHLLGSMLRIDVDGPGVQFPLVPYAIPADNPFAGNARCLPGLNAAPCPEIYAWGLRNPWRWSFDPATGHLWLADVGQVSYEEVNRVERGGNYGWRCREGRHDYNTAGCQGGLIDPVTEYGRSLGNSITGGRVYRGSAIPDLVGRYVFGDYGSGRIWALQGDGSGGYLNDQLIDTTFGPTSFAADADGELYFTDISTSRLRKLMPSGPPVADSVAETLSTSGCTDPVDITRPYSGLLPYALQAPFWSDGSAKTRFIGLPNGDTITRGADGDWSFPPGTVLVKHFSLNNRLVETRHLMRHPDGSWAGYSYEWNPQQTEATRVRGGKTVDIAGQEWIFPSENDCMVCHTSAAGFSLGPESAQLNGDLVYPSTGRTANQLDTLDAILAFSTPLPAPAGNLPAMTSPDDPAASLDARARAYLHTNCAQCHRPGGPTPSSMDLRHDTALADTDACNVVPLGGDLGIAGARLIAPGDSARSLIPVRAARRDSHGMPPLGSLRVDTAGIDLLRDWIDGLSGCTP